MVNNILKCGHILGEFVGLWDWRHLSLVKPLSTLLLGTMFLSLLGCGKDVANLGGINLCSYSIEDVENVQLKFQNLLIGKAIRPTKHELEQASWEQIDFQRLKNFENQNTNTGPSVDDIRQNLPKKYLTTYQKLCELNSSNSNHWGLIIYVEDGINIKDFSISAGIQDKNFPNRNIQLTPHLLNGGTSLDEVLTQLVQNDYSDWGSLFNYLVKGGFEVMLIEPAISKDRVFRIAAQVTNELTDNYLGRGLSLHSVVYVNDKNQISHIGSKNYNQILEEKNSNDR